MKILQTLLLLGMAVSIVGCSKASISSYRYFHVYTMTHPVKSLDRFYKDDSLSFRFEIKEKKIKVNIVNVGNNEVELSWPKVRYVDPHGTSHRIANKQTIFTRETNRIKPTTVSPGESETNLMVALDNMEEMEQWAWNLKPFFDQVDERAILNRKKKFSVVFPVKIAEEERTYQFDFMVSHVIAHQGFNPN